MVRCKFNLAIFTIIIGLPPRLLFTTDKMKPDVKSFVYEFFISSKIETSSKT
jgi:hypothetical protein